MILEKISQQEEDGVSQAQLWQVAEGLSRANPDGSANSDFSYLVTRVQSRTIEKDFGAFEKFSECAHCEERLVCVTAVIRPPSPLAAIICVTVSCLSTLVSRHTTHPIIHQPYSYPHSLGLLRSQISSAVRVIARLPSRSCAPFSRPAPTRVAV